MHTSLFNLLHRLWLHMSAERRRQFWLLMLLTVLGSVAEIVSLGAIFPFIGVLTQPEKVFASPKLAVFVQYFGISSAQELIVPLSVAFVLAAIFTGTLRLLLLKSSIRFANATGADLSINVYRRTLYQPYSVHVARSSSEIISGITQKVGAVSSVLLAVAGVITSSVLFCAILTTLFVINPLVAALSMFGFGCGYMLISRRAQARLFANSAAIAREQTKVVKSLQEGLGAIRDILLDGTQAIYCADYAQAIQHLRKAGGENTYINQAPRFAMETVGMVLIAALALFLNYQPGGMATAFPVLAALALGAQRLLPLLQQLYGSWAVAAGSHATLIDVLKLLDQPLPSESHHAEPDALRFKKNISFSDVSFRYHEQGPWVLRDIQLTIAKGSRVGFVGTTGSGKSTALDLLMGLLEPTRGNIVVDGHVVSGNLQRAWQRSIAHVPQSIYLADTTLAENIAFGVPAASIDMERVKRAARQAQLAEFIESRPEAYQALVGERGIRLSGGQRQRIGIARALYKEASVLIFDEATSALDNETELAVMSAIENLDRDLTILIIAHRLTTLRHCDTIVRLEGGQMITQGSYEHFMKQDTDLRGVAQVEFR